MTLPISIKKITLVILSIFLFSIKGSTQDEKKSVPIIAYWSKGDSYNFKVTKIKKQWSADKQTKNDSTTQVVNFKVIDSTEKTYTIHWTYESDLGTDYNIPDKYLEKFSKYKETRVIYTTSETGEFKGIENWKELSAMVKNLSTELTAILANDKGLNQEEVKKTMAPIFQIYQSKEGIEQIVYKELQVFHFPFGFELEPGKPILYEESLPNMFGGAPLKGDSKIYVEKVDWEKEFCVVSNEMRIDPDDAKRVVLEVFKKMNLKDEEFKKAMSAAVFEITDKNKFEIYLSPGVPDKIETNRLIILELNNERSKRIDITRIELLN